MGRTGTGLALGPGEFTCSSEILEICQKVPGFLRRSVGGSLEEPWISGHDRIGNEGSWRVQMRKLPIFRAN
jgi:hypothetical protein